MMLYDVVSGYLSCPCQLEGSLFTRVAAAEDSAAPDVEIRLLNTLIGNSLETMSQFEQITNINAKVSIVLTRCEPNCIMAVVCSSTNVTTNYSVDEH